MSAPPFVLTLRNRGETVVVGTPNGAALNLRVEIPELWDVVRVSAASGSSVADVKRAALDALTPGADPTRYVMKLRGIEVLDESEGVEAAGARDGSIFLLPHRRRRPVR